MTEPRTRVKFDTGWSGATSSAADELRDWLRWARERAQLAGIPDPAIVDRIEDEATRKAESPASLREALLRLVVAVRNPVQPSAIEAALAKADRALSGAESPASGELREAREFIAWAVRDVPPGRTFEDWHDRATVLLRDVLRLSAHEDTPTYDPPIRWAQPFGGSDPRAKGNVEDTPDDPTPEEE